MSEHQMDMWGKREHPEKPGIDLRCCDVAEILDSIEDGSIDLLFSDPPWVYGQKVGGNGPKVDEHYACLSNDEIGKHMLTARRKMKPGGRCVLWTTHSQLPALAAAVRQDDTGAAMLWGWRWATGGTWAKVRDDDAIGGRGAPGIGYHCLSSESEIWLMLLADGPHYRANVAGCRVIPRHRGRGESHSEKPISYQQEMISKWVDPGGIVLDLYAGMGTVARACLATGRRYIGAEIDPVRHEKAMAKRWRQG